MKSKFEISENENSDCGTTTLTKEQFRDFALFLNIVRDDFIDFWINNGEFRARTNNHTCVVETGFTYFENLTFLIADIKHVIRTLSVLDKTVTINVTVDETAVIFNDGYQNINIKKAPYEYADNPFVSEQEMKEIFYENIDTKKPLISETFPGAIVSNIKKMADELNTTSIFVKHNEEDLNKGNVYISDQAGITSASSSKFCEYSYNLKKSFLNPIKHNYYFELNIHPFVYNKSDMTINCYLSKSQDLVLTIYTVVVGKLLINIYGR